MLSSKDNKSISRHSSYKLLIGNKKSMTIVINDTVSRISSI
jgi:hypothetical protein